jgi:hypothetical protein
MEQIENKWISIGECLPEPGVYVFVYGVLDESFQGIVWGDIRRRDIWITKRIKPGQHTDGNGFARLHGYGHLSITHWLPIPELDGKEIFETLPVG